MAWQFVNQLDGTENQRNNCVPACISMLIWNEAGLYLAPDAMKDAVYGPGYLGGQAASKYVGLCASHGVTLAPYNGVSTALVDEMVAALDAGKRVIFTIPTSWAANINTGSTHVMIAYGRSGNDFYIADPWGGVARTWSRDYITPRLRMNQIWIGDKPVSTDLAAAGWHDSGSFDPNAAGVLVAPNGIGVESGFRTYVLSHPWDGGNWPLRAEYPANPIEPGNPAMGAGSRIDFRGNNGPVSLGYLPAPINGHPAGVYVIWVGQDIIALENQLAAANARIAAATKALGG